MEAPEVVGLGVRADGGLVLGGMAEQQAVGITAVVEVVRQEPTEEPELQQLQLPAIQGRLEPLIRSL